MYLLMTSPSTIRKAVLKAIRITDGIQNMEGVPSNPNSVRRYKAIKAPGLVCCGVPVAPRPTWITKPNDVSRTRVLSKMPATTRFNVSFINAVFIRTERILPFAKP